MSYERQIMGNPVVHWELMSKDPAKVSDFYAKTFGWKVSHRPEMNYRIVDTGAEGEMRGINGGIVKPEKPGPWASVLSMTGVDVFKLGPMFIGFGIAWLIFVAGLFAGSSWAYWLGMIVAVLTLWYLPFGTIISLIVLAVLIFFRERVITV